MDAVTEADRVFISGYFRGIGAAFLCSSFYVSVMKVLYIILFCIDTILLASLAFLLMSLLAKGATALSVLADISGIAVSIALLVLVIGLYLKLPHNPGQK
ncbi:MAG: hypothetical protein JNL51_16790 [Chitinophagaceae bacterium]|nr:hypothetical protein [Chitinophagaceae bacterium]